MIDELQQLRQRASEADEEIISRDVVNCHNIETSGLGSIVRAFRKDHKLTQAQMAKQLNISRTYLSRIERGIATNLSFALGKHILDLPEYHGTISVLLSRRVRIDAAIAEEIVWLSSQGVVTEGCCKGPPPSATIYPSSVDKAEALGYEPFYREEVGMFGMPLKSDVGR